jgi:hypothetical protein
MMATRTTAPKNFDELLWRADLLGAVLGATERGLGPARTLAETVVVRGLNPGFGALCELVDLASRMFRRLAADTLRLRRTGVQRIPRDERARLLRSMAVSEARLQKLLQFEPTSSAADEAWLRRQLEGLEGGGR